MLKKLGVLAISSVVLLSACSSEDTAGKESDKAVAVEQNKVLPMEEAIKSDSPENVVHSYFDLFAKQDIEGLSSAVINEQKDFGKQVLESTVQNLKAQGSEVQLEEIVSTKEQDGLALVLYILKYLKNGEVSGYEINQLPFIKQEDAWKIAIDTNQLPHEQMEIFTKMVNENNLAFQNDENIRKHLEWVEEQNRLLLEQAQRDMNQLQQDSDTANQMHQDAVNQHNQMMQQQQQQMMTPPPGMP